MAAITGQYKATQPTYTDGDFVEVLPTDSKGNLMVNIAAGEEINVGTLTLGTINMIKAGTISAGTINSGTINAGTINSGTINHGTIDSGTINAGTINSGTINAGTINTGTINAGTIDVLKAGTINAGTINSGTINAGTINAGTVTLNTLISGEDQTNDVLKVEGQFSYYHHVGTAGSVSGTVKAAAGFLHSVIYNTHTAGGTYAFYNSSGTSADVIAIVAPGAALPPLTSIYDVKFTTGLTVVSGSACDLTFCYR